MPFKLHNVNLLYPLDAIKIGEFGAVLDDNKVDKAVEYLLKKASTRINKATSDPKRSSKKVYVYVLDFNVKIILQQCTIFYLKC